MAGRYDKYDPISGGFRAPLAAAITPDANGEFGPVGVSLDANGRVVLGTGGQTGLIGVVIKNVPKMPAGLGVAAQVLTGIWQGVRAGDIVDVMTHGEIVDVPGLVAGTKYYVTAGATGVLTATGTANFLIGHTVEANRLIVRVPFGRAAGA